MVIIITERGVSSRPVSAGDMPKRVSAKYGTNDMTEKMPMPYRRLYRFTCRNGGRTSIAKSSIGSWTRFSWRTNSQPTASASSSRPQNWNERTIAASLPSEVSAIISDAIDVANNRMPG